MMVGVRLRTSVQFPCCSAAMIPPVAAARKMMDRGSRVPSPLAADTTARVTPATTRIWALAVHRMDSHACLPRPPTGPHGSASKHHVMSSCPRLRLKHTAPRSVSLDWALRQPSRRLCLARRYRRVKSWWTLADSSVATWILPSSDVANLVAFSRRGDVSMVSRVRSSAAKASRVQSIGMSFLLPRNAKPY